MYKRQDSYLNQLEKRANKLLKDSSDQEDIYNKNTIDQSNRKVMTKRNRNYSKVSNSPTLSQKSYSQQDESSMFHKVTSYNSSLVSKLKQQIKDLEVQNQILKKLQSNQTMKQNNHSKSIETEIKKFKKQMRLKLQNKFSTEMEVWVKKVKKLEKQKLAQEQEYQRIFQEKDQIIYDLNIQKKGLKKNIKKLNAFIINSVPQIAAQLKADIVLIQNCISHYYPK